MSQSRQTRATYLHGDFFPVHGDMGYREKGSAMGFDIREQRKIGAPFPSAHGMQTKSHTHRENIGSGGGSIQVSFANAHKTGTHYWAVYTGLHLLDILFSTLGGSHTFLFSTGTSTFFCSFSSRSQSFPPKALGGLTGGHHWAGRMDLGGFRMAWKPGKGGRGGGLFLSLGNPQGAWLRLALGIFVGSGCFFCWFLGRRRWGSFVVVISFST